MKTGSELVLPATEKPGPEEEKTGWTTVIRPKSPWFDIRLGEICQYRDLIVLFVWRDLVAQYKQMVLGPAWYVLTPLATTVVFTIVFGEIAKIPTDGVPPFLFYLGGTVCWTYFAGCLMNTSGTFVANAGIFGKVYFPRLVVPISIVISNLLKFLIQFCVFVAFVVYFTVAGSAISPTAYVFALPLLVVQMAFLGLGCGILVSSVTTKYRDFTVLVNFGVQLWMYATPVVYPLSQIPDHYRWLFVLNPMSSVVEGFRQGILGKGVLDYQWVVVSWLITLLILFGGIVLFSRIERTFMDTV